MLCIPNNWLAMDFCRSWGCCKRGGLYDADRSL